MEFGKDLNLKEVVNKEEIFLQMVKGVKQFHQLGFYHRNLKPENFMIGEDGKLKLIDFGIIKEIKDTIQVNQINTLRYIAPEVFFTQNYDQSVDIWSLGIIFFEILTNNPFFEDSMNVIQLLKKRAEISQLQINSKIKEHNLKNWQVEILQRMIVQRLDKNQQIIKQIKRIGINAIEEELEKQYKSQNIQEKETFKWIEKTEEMQSLIFINNKGSSFGFKFQIQHTKDYEIVYSQNGRILRKDQIMDFLEKPEVLTNIEQIKFFQWNGNYGANKKKVGQWSVTWKGQRLQGVGGQYSKINVSSLSNNGNKHGQWVEIIPNYWSWAKAIQIGQYQDNKRQGTWRYTYRDQEMGGGEYNIQGLKFGKWIELWEQFYDLALVKEIGLYNENGRKIGKWDIMYCKDAENGYKQMQILLKPNKYRGGGSYDQDGNQKKIGKWVELVDGFSWGKQITQNGQYNMQGMKIGRWDIMYCNDRWKNYKQIGGGLYDLDGNLQKIGVWVELDEGFRWDKQVTYSGEYNMQGMKIGRWDSKQCPPFRENEYKQMQILLKYYKYSGGGSYDQDGNQKKIGKWVELIEGFKWDKQVTYIGEYNMQGMKIGNWKRTNLK
ncbi:unnamed protein product [Paramecium sonneborni]|uniref:Protein kinase domain-containing protein n=1 Tax=Paramecium sonneborni TaxID=65129 RepID=A0A8S1PXB9_9CILI|nr:unnamed protein product [Paramecium sonneborni]